MLNIAANTFSELTAQYFAPLAENAGLSLRMLREGVFEVAGAEFVMRIRRATGHRKDFLVTLSPIGTTQDLDDLSGEIGLAVIAEYNGHPLQAQVLDSIEGWQLAFEDVAHAASTFCLPYLTGQQDDLHGVRHFIEKKVEASVLRIKKYRFPRNVREEWI